jgi:hypothetical protein
VLADRKTPLVLAADESLLPIYRRANSYSHTMNDTVTGNPDNRSDKQLRDAAWPIIHQRHSELQSRALAEFANAAAQNQASAQLEDILPAATDGRIDKLLIADRRHCWGRFDSATRQLVVHDQPQAGDEDLINVAAVMAYLRGSKIYTLAADEMNGHSPVAAVYRY